MVKIYSNPSRDTAEDGYRKLATAIVNLAVGDLKSAASRNDTGSMRELERFFYSGWCTTLIPLEWESDGAMIYKRILSDYSDI